MCMRRCLDDARITAAQVGYINAHATSTIVGDRAEAASIAALGVRIATSSIKGLQFSKLFALFFEPKSNAKIFSGHIGHCVSAAGALETIVGLCAMRDALIPPTLNFEAIDIDADVDFVRGDECRVWPGDQRRVMLKNSFGFGGAFVTIAFGEGE